MQLGAADSRPGKNCNLIVWTGTWRATIRAFEEKAADIHRPLHESASACSCIVTLSMRKRPFRRWTGWIPCCRSRPAAPNGMVSEYYRHGTLSLYAALDVKTGKVEGKTTRRHTSADFIEFPEGGHRRQNALEPKRFISCSITSPRTKTPAVQEFLRAKSARCTLSLHADVNTPSWLNQVGAVVRQNPAGCH